MNRLFLLVFLLLPLAASARPRLYSTAGGNVSEGHLYVTGGVTASEFTLNGYTISDWSSVDVGVGDRLTIVETGKTDYAEYLSTNAYVIPSLQGKLDSNAWAVADSTTNYTLRNEQGVVNSLKLDSNTWGTADSTTNYTMRTVQIATNAALLANIETRLLSNQWASADSTTNYVQRTAGTPVYVETDPLWAAASGSVITAISERLDSNVWALAGSTTNYLPRTGGTMSGDLAVAGNITNSGALSVGGAATIAGDVIVGSPTTEDDGDPTHDSRMFFDKSKGAFRAGGVTSTNWNDANRGNYSFASGGNTIASSDYSTAMGNNTIASSDYSTAMGNNTIASGNSSAAMGAHTTAQAYNSTVLGRYNVIAGTTGSWVDTDPLFVIGNGTATNARNNAVTVLKNGNFGIGTATPRAKMEVEGNLHINLPDFQTGRTFSNALVIRNSDASGIGGTFGSNVYGGGISWVYGTAGTIQPRSAIASVQTTDDVDQQGLAFFTHPSTDAGADLVEVVRIVHSGNVGIGTATPSNRLEVAGTSGSFGVDTSGVRLNFSRAGTSYFDATQAGGSFSFVVNGNTDPEAALFIASGNNVGIGTTAPNNKLDVAGTIKATTISNMTIISSPFAKIHRVASNVFANATTWENISWDLTVPEETSWGISTSTADTITFDFAGHVNIDGCLRPVWTGADNTDAYIASRVIWTTNAWANTNEARCLQAYYGREQKTGQMDTAGYKGSLFVTTNTQIRLQGQVSSIDMILQGQAIFDNPVSASINIYCAGKIAE